MPYQVSTMGWVGSGEDFCGLGWVRSRNFGLGWVLKKVTHDKLWVVVVVAVVVVVFEDLVLEEKQSWK